MAAPPAAPALKLPAPPLPIMYPLLVRVRSPFKADEIVKAAVDVLSDHT
jgi:hypothetical protein